MSHEWSLKCSPEQHHLQKLEWLLAINSLHATNNALLRPLQHHQAAVLTLAFELICCCVCEAGVFDVKAVRRALEMRVKSLEAEKQQVRLFAGAHKHRAHNAASIRATLMSISVAPLL